MTGIGLVLEGLLFGIGAVIAVFLAVQSLSWTGRNTIPQELVSLERDRFWRRLLLPAALTLLSGALAAFWTGLWERRGRGSRSPEGKSGAREGRLWGKALIAVFLCAYAAACAWWIRYLEQGFFGDDTGICWSTAVQFSGDNYAMLDAMGYLTRYPQQIGVVAVDLLGIRLFGEAGAQLFYWGNAALLVLSLYAGMRIARLLTRGEMAVQLLAAVFALLDLPAFFYVNYLYGEVASLTGILVMAWGAAELITPGKRMLSSQRGNARRTGSRRQGDGKFSEEECRPRFEREPGVF